MITYVFVKDLLIDTCFNELLTSNDCSDKALGILIAIFDICFIPFVIFYDFICIPIYILYGLLVLLFKIVNRKDDK